MAWADRATLLVGLFWAVSAFILMGGTQRPDLTLFQYLETFALFWGIPTLFVWIVFRLILGNKGAL